ncbi:type VI secretion system tip protein TssI/VgrG [Candidatus Methylospira mobilis]|nr:type VI secretion system tip protein TssI/VgrG [Candidatus Methylospira mobilis]WNV03890.1 type VI secretion system tip protein TssI/VgrG [Candidatus Methylospira mobilis]
MNSQLAGSNRRFSFICEQLNAGTTLEVVSFEGEESLAELYRFNMLLVSSRNDIDERKLIGHSVSFTLNDGIAQGKDTCYIGLIQSFEQLHQISGWTFYKAVLVPKLWRLAQYHLSEVYLSKAPPELLKTVMDNAGLFSNEYNLNYMQPAGYDTQGFICQYKESYLDFLSRWCEHLGIYWWYSQQQNGEQVVFGNNFRNHDAHVIKLNYQPAGELDADITRIRRVQSFNLFAQSLPKQVTVMDYHYKKASLEIKGSAQVDPMGIGEVTYYGLYVKTNEAAQALAKIRAEGLICRGRQFGGESSATGMRCGYLMELAGHYRTDFNQRYLLTRISHRGSQAGLLLEGLNVPVQGDSPGNDFYQASFSAIPAEVQFRPEIVHPWPKIEGTLNAVIDAEGDGKYAELNEFGEYKVQLPYDITEKGATRASAWIRMASPYAGPGDECSAHGMHFPLHKGAEVLLSFENGNPDKPVILGAVHNSVNPNLVKNENQTQAMIQTGGGNSLEFYDQDGQQGVHLFSPVCGSRISIGAPPNAAKGVGAESSSTPTYDGIGLQTSGTMAFTGQDKRSNIYGFSNSIVWGEYTSSVVGAAASTYLGGYMSSYLIGYKANVVGFKREDIFGWTWSSTIGAKTESIRGPATKTVTGTVTDVILGDTFKTVTGNCAELFNTKTSESKVEFNKNNLFTRKTSLKTIQDNITTISTQVKDDKAEAEKKKRTAITEEINTEVKKVQTSLDQVSTKVEKVESSVVQVNSAVEKLSSKVSTHSARVYNGLFKVGAFTSL